MAKKKKFQETTIEDFYDLKVDKVEELVAALKDEDYVPETEISMNISDCTGETDPKNVKRNGKQKQFNPYKTDFLARVPAWIKAIFVKWWFCGLVCYFVNMGLGTNMNTENLIIINGVALGLIVELFVNPLLMFLETRNKEFNRYIMFPFPFKAYWTFFTNILYYVFVILCVNGVYYLINTYMFSFYIEPLSMGVICVAVDMAFIGIKDGVVALVKKLRKKENEVNV